MAIEILDIIEKKHNNDTSYYLVLSSLPRFKYSKRDNLLVAEDDGFFSCYSYSPPSKGFQAFGGVQFDIPLTDGTTVRATGQWWCASPRVGEPTLQVGINTYEGLQECYVFLGGRTVLESKVREWLNHNTPSNDYFKYQGTTLERALNWTKLELYKAERRKCSPV